MQADIIRYTCFFVAKIHVYICTLEFKIYVAPVYKMQSCALGGKKCSFLALKLLMHLAKGSFYADVCLFLVLSVMAILTATFIFNLLSLHRSYLLDATLLFLHV